MDSSDPPPLMADTDAFRSSFRIDLLRNVLYNREDVLPNLLGSPSLETEKMIHAIAMWVEKDCDDQLREILAIESLPSRKRDEKAMYPPLKKLFRFIEISVSKWQRGLGGTRPFFRQAIAKDNEKVKLEDPLFPEASYGKPDFMVADVPARGTHRDNNMLTDEYPSKLLRWRQCPAFIEVKSSSLNRPSPANDADVKDTLLQGADYARMILASRPFQLYTYGLFICGTAFNVGVFDRCGISLSPDMQITNPIDRRQFVHIIVRLLWDMSPVELGLDPTVEMLPGETYYQEDFPRFRVTVDDGSASAETFETVETVGAPLWLSYSLLGRGTSIWPALTAKNSPGDTQDAWRTPGRKAEADIYAEITSLLERAGVPYPRGVARPSSGGDVMYDGALLSVSTLRDLSADAHSDKRIVDRVLHRVILEDYGKPLWQWSDVKEFVLALRDVVEGHKVLYELGVLHRDISAGNILIRVIAWFKPPTRHVKAQIATAQPEGEKIGGFLTDFELASVKDKNIATEQPEKKAGDTISGTPLFMATSLLQASLDEERITRTVEHDLEALCWVIVYAIFMHALGNTKGDRRRKLRDEFEQLFCATSIQKLISLRVNALGPSLRKKDPDARFKGIQTLLQYAAEVHQALAGLLDLAWILIGQAQPRYVHAEPVRPEFRSIGVIAEVLEEDAGAEEKAAKVVKSRVNHKNFLDTIQTALRMLEKSD
ncbi:hypothetical protein C8T65DRAFT_86497 [Cerioporus squamosus]|nr:hypothetical protein C8T65DRAFT_86497 [Cerioporus squamosus]